MEQTNERSAGERERGIMERTVTRTDARTGDGEETRRSEKASTSSSPDAAFAAGKKVDASPPGLGGYAPLSPALSGYLLKERRHSVSEYCQPLKLYLDILMFMTSFRNIDLLKQGYVIHSYCSLIYFGGQRKKSKMQTRK